LTTRTATAAPAEAIDTRRWSPQPFVALGVAAIATFAAARLAGLWTVDPEAANPFWLATGVAIGIALASPVRVRPLVVLGGIVGQAADSAFTFGADAHAITGDIVATAVEVGVGVVVFGWWFGRSDRMGRAGWTLAAFAWCFAVSAIGAVIAVAWFDPSSPATFAARWIMGDGLGIAAVGAFFLIPADPSSWRIGAEAGAGPVELVLTLAGVAGLVAWSFSTTTPVLFFVVAALLWLAVRFGPAVSVPVALAVVVFGCIVTVRDRGPFGSAVDDGLVYLQAFNATMLFSTLLVGRHVRAADHARRRSQALLVALPDLVSVRRSVPGETAEEPPTVIVEQISGSLGSAPLDAWAVGAVAGVDPGVAPTVTDRPEPPTTRIDMATVDGADRHVEHRSVAIDPQHSVTLSRDLTDQVALWRRAHDAERRWRRLATSAYEGYLELDRDGRIVEVTDRLAEMIGAEADELVGQSFRALMDGADLAAIEPQIRSIGAGGRTTFEAPFRARDGRRRWALVSAETLHDAAGAPSGLVVFAADTTDVHDAAEGRALAELRLATVEARERQRIARALHDGPLQSLVAISYQLNAMRHGAPADDATAQRLEDLALDALRRMRSSLEDLAPVDIEPSGLVQAFHALAGRFGAADTPEVIVTDRCRVPLTEQSATRLYRIGSEALVNAIIHAGAATVEVIIGNDADGATVDVVDDGTGFDHDAVGSDDGHLGLRAMRQRVLEAGGTLVLADVEPHGTRVGVRLPPAAASGPSGPPGPAIPPDQIEMTT
jgi:PAS domain S-box-containing protein